MYCEFFRQKYTIWGSWGWLGAPALYHLCSAHRGPDRLVRHTATCARWATPFNAQQQRYLRLLSARADKLKTVFIKFESGSKVREKEISAITICANLAVPGSESWQIPGKRNPIIPTLSLALPLSILSAPWCARRAMLLLPPHAKTDPPPPPAPQVLAPTAGSGRL